MKQTGWRRAVKRAVDAAAAGSVLLAAAPALAIAGVAVAISMGRPVLFSQTRPGLHGRPFRIWKLRTMRDTRGADGELLADADRMTTVGRFLRRTSLDELPQLVNVLRGEMSLVGPRPLLVEYLDLYTPEQARRHDVLPGITGWAQVHGRNATQWSARLAHDVWYADNWSLGLDVRIVAATIRTIVLREGVEAPGHATMPKLTRELAREAVANA